MGNSVVSSYPTSTSFLWVDGWSMDPRVLGCYMNIDLRKKFQCIKFRYFYELAAKVIEYEELLKEECYRRKKSMGTYCQEVNQEVVVAYLSITGTFTCPLLVEKAPDLWKRHKFLVHRSSTLLR